MYPIHSAASASASSRGGNEGGNSAEVGGGDACLEMRKVQRGALLMMGVGVGCWEFRGSVIIIVVHQLHEKERKRGSRALTAPRRKPPIQTTHLNPWNQIAAASYVHGEHQKEAGKSHK